MMSPILRAGSFRARGLVIPPGAGGGGDDKNLLALGEVPRWGVPPVGAMEWGPEGVAPLAFGANTGTWHGPESARGITIPKNTNFNLEWRVTYHGGGGYGELGILALSGRKGDALRFFFSVSDAGAYDSVSTEALYVYPPNGGGQLVYQKVHPQGVALSLAPELLRRGDEWIYRIGGQALGSTTRAWPEWDVDTVSVAFRQYSDYSCPVKMAVHKIELTLI